MILLQYIKGQLAHSQTQLYKTFFTRQDSFILAISQVSPSVRYYAVEEGALKMRVSAVRDPRHLLFPAMRGPNQLA
jgi:hypothetical protein